MVDAYQVYEARALGADCILLIVAALDLARMQELEALAPRTGHGGAGRSARRRRAELRRSRWPRRSSASTTATCAPSRRGSTTTLDLLPRIPPGRLVVTESGILARADVALMRAHGVQAFLAGEAFMRAADPGAELTSMFGATPG